MYKPERPEAVANERSEGATKGLRLINFVDSTLYPYN